MDKPCCEICGRDDRKIIRNLCPRHKIQIEEHGYALDNNNLDEYDKNEIIRYNDHAEIILYDNLFNELDDRVLIDLEDINIIEDIIWKKQSKYIVGIGTDNQCMYELPNLILDTDDRVYHIDGNIFNNKKENLEIIKKKKYKHHFSNSKKHKNKILITALGGSVDGVTGSCFAIEYTLDNGNKDLVLVECGSIQTNRIQEDYIANKKMIEGIPFNLASAIFLCHDHSDHVGSLPSGITRGFNGKIITTFENAEILKPMLLDSSFIHSRNVTSLNNRGKKYETLYDEGDVYSTLSKVETYSIDEIHKLNSNLSFRITNSNHCIASTQLELFIKKPSGRIVKVVYTSDIGSKYNQKYKPYSEERVDIPKANCLIMESTYGSVDRGFTKKDADEDYKKLINKIKEVTYRGNRILIPVFSLDRAQSMMTLIYNEFKDDPKFKKIKVIVDSRLLNTINQVYRTILKDEKLDLWNEVLSWDNFIFVEEFKRTEILAQDKDSPCVILSSSGMMSAGHCTTYAKYILPNKRDCVAFIGYASPNTPAGLIQRGNKSVLLDNVNINVNCEIQIYKGFSGHCQMNELIQIMKNINCDLIAIHHGDKNSKETLKFKAEEEFLFSNMSKKIKILDKKNNQIIL